MAPDFHYTNQTEPNQFRYAEILSNLKKEPKQLALCELVRKPSNECVCGKRERKTKEAERHKCCTLTLKKAMSIKTNLCKGFGIQKIKKFSARNLTQIHKLYSFAPHWNQLFFKRIAACLVLWMFAALAHLLNEWTLLSVELISPLFRIPNIIALHFLSTSSSFFSLSHEKSYVWCFFHSLAP